MAHFHSPRIITDGLVLALDAANVKSYASTTLDVEYLIVAGGGGGGGNGGFSTPRASGGGGAGGVLFNTIKLNNSIYSIIVGSGGSGNINGTGSNGTTSSAFNITTLGGGAGGGRDGGGATAPNQNGANGGSGGGAGREAFGGTSTITQGNDGGSASSSDNAGSGGGGAAFAGQPGISNDKAGDGGAGVSLASIFTSNFADGGWVGGGGAGAGTTASGRETSSAIGGIGGGGNTFTNALINTGGGGGAGGVLPNTSLVGNGGSGIVIIRYRGGQRANGGTVTTANGWTIHTFTASGTFQVGTHIGDMTPNGNNGELVNGVGFNSDNLGSLVFDGVDDYIPIPSLLNSQSIGSLTQLTVSLWLNISVYGSNMPFSTGQTGNDRIYYWTQSSLNMWRIGDYTSTVGQSTLPVVGSWFQTVLVISGLTLNVYLNGQFDYTGTYTAFNTADFVTLGRHGTQNAYRYNGRISQVQIYNKALTAQEVLQNYNATKGRYGL